MKKVGQVLNQVLVPQEERNHKEDLSSSFLGVKAIAEYLAIKRSGIYAMVESRKFPHYHIGRQIRFKKDDIDRWMQERKEEAVDSRIEVKKVFRSIERKADLDINRIVERTIEGTKKERYTSPEEKPGRIKGLRKEVQHGII